MISSEYRLRYSKKAKYLQLRVIPEGFEVVIPERQRITHTTIEDFIQKNQQWIANHEKSLKTPISLPDSIDLQAIEQHWQVRYLKTHHARITLHMNPACELTLMGNINDEEICFAKLRQWLIKMGEKYLPHLLKAESQATNLIYNEITIRNNLTRWGSCNTRKDISLCCRLLFLPFHLTRHILLHELCHTQIMNHGKKFWNLLEKHDKNTKQHVKQLKNAALYIPNWV